MDQLTARKLLKSRTRGNTPTASLGGPRSPILSSKNNSAMHLDDLAHADSTSTLNSLSANQKLSSSSYGGREVEHPPLNRHLSRSTAKMQSQVPYKFAGK